MDKVIVILGDQTDEVAKTLNSYYKESIEVMNSFRSPSEFAQYYEKTPLRVKRIIITESSFSLDKYTELPKLKEALERFFIVFEQCYFLVSNNEETNELLDILTTDETFAHGEKIRVFNHERYTPKMVIDYTMNKIPRKHFVENSTEYEEIIRRRKNAESTFKLDEEDKSENDIVVLDSDKVSIRHINQKLKNLESLSNIVKGEQWENNKIIKDIYKIEQLMTVAKEEQRYEIDYTNFYLTQNIKTFKNNIILVTGERRSGKSVMAYALAKSASKTNKVLLVDFDVVNLGLSHLAETIADSSTVMLLQHFKMDFKNSLRTLVKSPTTLNMVASNTKTAKELDGIDPVNFLSMIINTCSKYFDNIIFDIPITKVNEIVPLMKGSEKILITVPTNLNNVVSTVNIIRDLKLTEDFKNKDLVFVPVDMYNRVGGVPSLKGEHVKQILTKIYSDKAKVFPKIEMGSFNLDDSLYRAVKSI